MDSGIGPGERITIDGIAADLSVSQTPVREALARLEADGLVTKEAHKSYRVAPRLSPADMVELYEFRLLIEPFAAASAARTRTVEQLATLERTSRELEAAAVTATTGEGYADFARFLNADGAFHDGIAIAAGNKRIIETLARLRSQLHAGRYHFPVDNDTVEEHARVLEAISAQEPYDAEAAMRNHLEAACGRLSTPSAAR